MPYILSQHSDPPDYPYAQKYLNLLGYFLQLRAFFSLQICYGGGQKPFIHSKIGQLSEFARAKIQF